MSYIVALEKDGNICLVEPHSEGANKELGGSLAEMAVTYNYYTLFVLAGIKDFRHDLCGLQAIDSLPILASAIAKLGPPTRDDDVLDYKQDYWTPTPGNASRALMVMLKWAAEHPYARWSIS